jgi:hypothetical protein
MKLPMALQIVGMLLFGMLIIIVLSVISPWFFEHIIGEREFYRIVILTVLLSLYGMFCKASGRLSDEGSTADAQYNRIIVGAAFLLSSFITAFSQCTPADS